MRIVIDMQGAQTESRFRGIGRYTLSFVQSIVRNRGEHEIILALSGLFPQTIEPIRAAFDGLLPQKNICVWHAPGPVLEECSVNDARREVAELIREAFLASLHPDVIHISSLFEGYLDDAVTSIGRFDQSTLISVILYDLIPLLNPSHYLKPNPRYEQYYLRKVSHLKQATTYLAISEFTRQEGITNLHVPPSRVVNVATAIEANFRPHDVDDNAAAHLRQKFGLTLPFVLYTGGGDERKNLPRLIQAYAALPAALRTSHQLVFAGKMSEGIITQLNDQAKSAGLKPDELRFTGYVSDDELIKLYNLCKLFVFPSWHEGFGLPVLEAMACGAPVISTNSSSLPEIVGLSAALFDPLNVASISAKMTEALEDEAFRRTLRANGLKQATLFSWDETAKIALAAWESLHKMQLLKPLANTFLAGSKPRLAYVSPLPPERSGIADYSAALLPALSAYYDIDIVVAQDRVDDPWVNRYGQVRDVAWLRDHAHAVDRVLYQVGNSPLHQHMLQLIQAIPGTVVLHDYYLSSLMAWLEDHAGIHGIWIMALYSGHGYGAVRDRYRDAQEAKRQYPANWPILHYAQGIIVHSKYSRDLAQQWHGEDCQAEWEVIPLLRSPPRPFDKATARRQLGISESDFVICSFGFLDAVKLNHRLLSAWLESALARDKRCQLVFVGENHGGDYGASLLTTIGSSGLDDRIHITGYVSPELFQQYLAAADMAVQLRTHSRGETSAAVLDCMNYALPLIVNANGSMAELDPEAVWMLADDFLDSALVDALETLWNEVERRRSLGDRARKIILDQHIPAECAKHYSAAIEHFYRRTKTATPALINAIAEQKQLSFDEIQLQRVAKDIAASLLSPQPAKRLFLDLSATCRNDLKTGIERVARAITLALLDAPPAGYRIEPVYLSNTGGAWHYRYARRYTLALLGCPADALEDELAELQAGDILLGLDLSGDMLVQAEQSGLFQDFRDRGVTVYFMVHDLLPVRLPEMFPPGAAEGHAQWLRSISRFDGAICVSRTVAVDLNSWQAEMAIDYSQRRPYHIGWSHHGADIGTSAPSLGLPEDAAWLLGELETRPSFLMVGTIEPRKGYLQTIEAFTQLWSEGSEFNLVIVGREGWKSLPDGMRRDIPQTIERLRFHPELNTRLFWLDGISDEYLEKVYAASTCLIAASYGEGFGLPIIEAAQHHLPIIARDIPVFREVAGMHAYYFDAASPNAMAQAIKIWFANYAKNEAPLAEDLPFLTWKQSAARLVSFCKTPIKNAPKPSKIFFDHLVKTAGSSIRQLFADLLGEDKVSGVIRNMKFGAAVVAYSSKKVITGHFDFMPGDRLPAGYLTATVLRDPRERALSLYYFQRNDVPDAGLNAKEKEIKSISLEAALHHEIFIDQIANTQAVHFAKFFHPNPKVLPPSELLSLAKKGLDQYHLIGVTEQIEEFAELVKAVCDCRTSVSLKYKNVTSVRQAFKDLSPALQNRIDALTEVDRALWNFAKSRFAFLQRHPEKCHFMGAAIDNLVPPIKSFAVMQPDDLNKEIFELQDVQMISQLRPGSDFISGEWIDLQIAFRCLEGIEDLTIGYSIFHDSGLHIFGTNTRILGSQIHVDRGGQGIVRFSFPLNVGIGSYYLDLSAHTGLSHLDCCYMLKSKALFFNVVGFGDVTFEGLARLVPLVSISPGEVGNTELLKVTTTPSKMQIIGRRNPLVEQPLGSLRILVPLENVEAGTQMVVPVAITNESEVDWVSGGTYPVFVSYHWHSLDGVAITFDGIRTPLPQGSIAPGVAANGIAFIETPLEKGDHLLEITIMQEGSCWFEEYGFQSARTTLSVI